MTHRRAWRCVFGLVLATVLQSCGSTQPTPTPKSLTVSCDVHAFSAIGQQAHCAARVTLSDGSNDDRTATAQWTSSDSSRVTVSNGLVTGVGAGTADITATFQSMSGHQAFTVNVGCGFALTPGSASFAPSGGSQVVAISAMPPGCSPSTWTATSSSKELTLSTSSGDGSGNVTVTSAPNLGNPETRTATIAGQTFTASVDSTCRYAFSADAPDTGGNTWHVDAAAGDRSATVIVSSGSCLPWTATSSDSWITISQTKGASSSTIRIGFAANAGAGRTGSVTFRPPDCSPLCGASSFQVFVTQAARTVVLSVTLIQGLHLSGPYSGTVTGPNGFTCSLGSLQETVQCPPLSVPLGDPVNLTVINFSGVPFGDQPIYQPKTVGCDAVRAATCSLMMSSDRSVTIAIGDL